jgi:hypothetical protein
MKRPLIVTGVGLLILTGAYFHFHDGPPPDLTRFTQPAHDPVAFAEVKKLTDEIRANFKEYKPADPGDPEEYPIDETKELDVLALQRDANAVRALRRHLKENEKPLAAAHRLITLEKIAFEPPLPGNAFATPTGAIFGIKHSFRLIHRETLLAGIEKQNEPAWDTLVEELYFLRRSENAHITLITGLTLLAAEGIDQSAANDLAAFEKNPERIRKFLTVMEDNRPDPLQFKSALSVEFLGFADTVLPSRGGKINLRDLFTMGFGLGAAKPATMMEWLKESPKHLRDGWLVINTLPNDTAYEYGKTLDRELAVTIPNRTKTTPTQSEWGLWLLARNSGGTDILNKIAGNIFTLIRSKYFQNVARHDLTRLALAIRVYQLTHNDNRPATLAALAPDILPRIPTDVFAGGTAFRYDSATGKVWSVGVDGKDDGGDSENHDDIAVAPPVLTPPPAPVTP